MYSNGTVPLNWRAKTCVRGIWTLFYCSVDILHTMGDILYFIVHFDKLRSSVTLFSFAFWLFMQNVAVAVLASNNNRFDTFWAELTWWTYIDLVSHQCCSNIGQLQQRGGRWHIWICLMLFLACQQPILIRSRPTKWIVIVVYFDRSRWFSWTSIFMTKLDSIGDLNVFD